MAKTDPIDPTALDALMDKLNLGKRTRKRMHDANGSTPAEEPTITSVQTPRASRGHGSAEQKSSIISDDF